MNIQLPGGSILRDIKGDGVHVVYAHSTGILVYDLIPSLVASFSITSVNCVALSKDYVYVGTSSGVYLIYRSTWTISLVRITTLSVTTAASNSTCVAFGRGTSVLFFQHGSYVALNTLGTFSNSLTCLAMDENFIYVFFNSAYPVQTYSISKLQSLVLTTSSSWLITTFIDFDSTYYHDTSGGGFNDTHQVVFLDKDFFICSMATGIAVSPLRSYWREPAKALYLIIAPDFSEPNSFFRPTKLWAKLADGIYVALINQRIFKLYVSLSEYYLEYMGLIPFPPDPNLVNWAHFCSAAQIKDQFNWTLFITENNYGRAIYAYTVQSIDGIVSVKYFADFNYNIDSAALINPDFMYSRS